MKTRRNKVILLVIYFLALILSCINPIYPHEMYLQHSATIIMMGFMIYITVKNNLSDRSFLCFFIFMIFHIIGARWIYSFTPYNSGIKTLTGFNINEFFGWTRNNYDRFIHFIFGFLFLVPVSEIYEKWFHLPKRFVFHVAFLFILGSSMFYELFEWVISIALSPEETEAYNGQQGDMWDSQKDMALAMTGGMVMISIRRLTLVVKRLR